MIRLLALLPSWVWMAGLALEAPLRLTAWGACGLAVLALSRKATADDLLFGINWNFVLFVPLVEALYLFGASGIGAALIAKSEVGVCGAICGVLLWRLLRGERSSRIRRGVLLVGAGGGAITLMGHADPGPEDLAAVLALLFLGQTLLARMGAVATGAAGALSLVADEAL